MRKLIQIAVLSTMAVTGAAWADIKIAVLDYQMALLDSDAAKKYAVDSERSLLPS